VVTNDRDAFYMRKALQIAERGRGQTSPNPMVGAVLVDCEGTIVGTGVHERAGGPHAEVEALGEAQDAARGATLYCTLEPCSHTGRTGPCAPLVAQAGISRVVVASEDPNPLVSGRGLDLLRGRGIDVTTGILADEAQRLNVAFFTVMRLGRPFVTMKVATSLDGKVAARRGVRTRLTGPAADRRVHRDRAEVDAVAVGSGTILCDDPILTPRGAYRSRPLTRVIFDSRLRTPASARILSTLDAGPVIIVGDPDKAAGHPDRVAELTGAGAIVELVAGRERLASTLRQLARRGVTSLIIEGGPTLHEAFWNAGLVDRVQVYVAPRPIGAEGVQWLPFSIMSSPLVSERSARVIGEDTLLEAYVHRVD
jgi:diaminohydroxyphosphoribosylaminopyrimidine deaminase/5-amino-6-(5-phosphoribosylamino)uracil reductase